MDTSFPRRFRSKAMSEQCPDCGGELTCIDVNAEISLPGAPKSCLYEYRHLPPSERCSLALIPGVTHIRCFRCCKWLKGNKGALICLECIEKGFDYQRFDLKREDH